MVRVIPRLEVKQSSLVKGIHLEGLRNLGDAHEFAQRYEWQGADEILYLDCVASLHGSNAMLDLIRRATDEIFIPITVGGGVRTLDNIRQVLRAGADKVALNTAALTTPGFLREASLAFGASTVSVNIEYIGDECFYDTGREPSGKKVLDWALEAAEWCGELILTCVDCEGTRNGYDLRTVQEVAQGVQVPVVAAGGCGSVSDAVSAVLAGADAVACSSVLHYETCSIFDIKSGLARVGVPVRMEESWNCLAL